MNLIPWRNKRKEEGGSELTRFSPPIERLRTGMDRFFERFFRDPWAPLDAAYQFAGQWLPAVDIVESDDEVTVRAEIPGIEPKDLDVSVSGNVLTLSGEKKESHELKERDYYHSERRFGAFRRSIQLPCAVKADQVSAEYSGGVLTVNLKKQEAGTRKRVPVSVKEE